MWEVPGAGAVSYTHLDVYKRQTVAGYVDETGKVKVQDGSFKEAGFSGPGYMTVDPKDPNVLYAVSYTHLDVYKRQT